jgi:hypothetical protein
MIASFARRVKGGIMQQPNRRRRVWLALSVTLMVGMLVSLAACTPGSAGVSPQRSFTATAAASSTCPGTPSNQPCSPEPSAKGILSGKVVAGPTCPVENAEQPCPPRSVPNRLVLIETAGGTIVVRVTTDQQGQFEVTLAPGVYQVKVPPNGNPFPVQRTPQMVTVVAGQTVQVLIELDTGIR